jgi:adenylate cyclase, class 2
MMRDMYEIEKKYFSHDGCVTDEIVQSLNLEHGTASHEKDVYFTDFNGSFIRDRTCLRLRFADSSLTIDYKGKSHDQGAFFSKIESNLSVPGISVPGLYRLFANLGFHKYVTVDKHRTAYTRRTGNLTCALTVDKLHDIDAFIEIELTCPVSDAPPSQLAKIYDDVITKKIEHIRMAEATAPYRDIVARQIKERLLSRKRIVIDIDHLFSAGAQATDPETLSHAMFYNRACTTPAPNHLALIGGEIESINNLAKQYEIVAATSMSSEDLSPFMRQVGLNVQNMAIRDFDSLPAIDDDALAVISSNRFDDRSSGYHARVYKACIPGVALSSSALTFDTFTEMALIAKHAAPQ